MEDDAAARDCGESLDRWTHANAITNGSTKTSASCRNNPDGIASLSPGLAAAADYPGTHISICIQLQRGCSKFLVEVDATLSGL